MSSELEALKRVLIRERKARKASEKILEEKSLELYRANQELKGLYNSLETQYKKIVEQANDIIFRGNEKGHCVFVNAVVERILGYHPDELLGKHFTFLVIPEDQEEVIAFYLNQTMTLTDSSYKEFRVRSKNGDIRWLGQNVSLIIEDEKIIGTSGVARDITKQKLAEEAVKRSEAKYKSIIANMKLGLLEVDTKGIVTKAYDSFCEITGYSNAELMGQDPSLLLTDRSTKQMIDDKNKIRKKGESDVYEVKCKKKNGELLWMMISGAPRFNKEGNYIGSIGIHMDITEQKRLMHQLEAAKSLAEESAEAKDSFLAHMSHEIRTPLNAVIGMTHLLNDTETTHEQNDYLETIKHSSELLLGIINDILDLSKIESGELEFNQAPFDLYKLLEGQRKSFDLKATKKGVKVCLDWQLDIKTLLIGDSKFINQIFTNLIGNAEKFTSEGEIKVTAKALKATDLIINIEFKVSDTGKGIEADKLGLIFGSFKQESQSTAMEYGGTGLGLSIAKHLIEFQGGQIKVESEVGIGTTFTFNLPFRKSDLEVEETTDNWQKLASNFNGMKVLVAEDNAMNQKFISRLLEKFETNFSIVDDGYACLEKCDEEVFDVILMDIRMPKMQGYEVTEKLRSSENLNQKTPIVALTASALLNEKEKALKSGMDDHLTKPFHPEQLKEILSKYYIKSSYEPEVKKEIKVDTQYLNSFYGGDSEFEKEMTAIFLKNVETEMQELFAAAAEENWQKIYQAAHKNKPSFKMVGLNWFETQLEQIENLAKREDKAVLEEITLLRDLLKNAIIVVQNRFEALKGS